LFSAPLSILYIDINLCVLYTDNIDINQYEVVNLEDKYFNNARVFKAFCDENRLMVLEMLQSGEKCACVLLEELEITQPTLSHHMKILCDSGIVLPRKEGKWTFYSLSESGSKYAIELLKQLTTVTLGESVEAGCCI